MSTETPQFNTAEYSGSREALPQTGPSTTDRCRLCGNPLADKYYRVRGQQACASCAATAAQDALTGAGGPLSGPEGSAAFLRALLLGAVAALVGLVAYAAFTILTGFYLGYVAVGVGYLVARVMTWGSGGRVGRPYQIAALLLTYLGIALAEIPIAIWHLHLSLAHLLAISLHLLRFGLLSPFLELRDPVHGLINLVILAVGLRIAWRMTAAERVSVEGPFRLA